MLHRPFVIQRSNIKYWSNCYISNCLSYRHYHSFNSLSVYSRRAWYAGTTFFFSFDLVHYYQFYSNSTKSCTLLVWDEVTTIITLKGNPALNISPQLLGWNTRLWHRRLFLRKNFKTLQMYKFVILIFQESSHYGHTCFYLIFYLPLKFYVKTLDYSDTSWWLVY